MHTAAISVEFYFGDIHEIDFSTANHKIFPRMYLMCNVIFIATYKAIECEDKSAVQQWLEKEGTQANKYKGGRASHGHFFVGDGTALHWATYYGQLEIAKLLLDKGAGM